MKDYYAILNIKPDASPAHVDGAYRRMMEKYHQNVRATPQALERMRELHEAWRVLSDPAQRAVYDRARMMGIPYQPVTDTSARVAIASPGADFGVRPHGNTCLVALGVMIVLVFAVGVLGWDLNQRFNFIETFAKTQIELANLLPLNPTSEHNNIALDAATETPTADPRCRDGCETPPPGCVVKGDVDSDGGHYFYLPNDYGYGEVRVDVASGDSWFCALNDAQAAGWTRRAPTPTATNPPPVSDLTTAVARRAFVVCGEAAALHQAPSDDSAILQHLDAGKSVVVSGVVGDWSVVKAGSNTTYIRTNLLCTPSRAPTSDAPPAPTAQQDIATPTPSVVIASAAARPFKYPAPQLVSPTNGQHYWCSRELILQWSLNAPSLGADEYFLVESRDSQHETWQALWDWTKQTTVSLTPNKGSNGCDAFWWGNTGVYQWRVSVVQGSHTQPQYLSPFSESFDINYSH